MTAPTQINKQPLSRRVFVLSSSALPAGMRIKISNKQVHLHPIIGGLN
jgi:hypothetical protein